MKIIGQCREMVHTEDKGVQFGSQPILGILYNQDFEMHEIK